MLCQGMKCASMLTDCAEASQDWKDPQMGRGMRLSESPTSIRRMFRMILQDPQLLFPIRLPVRGSKGESMSCLIIGHG